MVMVVCGGGLWDHPRSRGVYRAHDHAGPRDGGSSPLARGLLLSTPARRGLVRIIPARAGFTLAEIGDLKARKDHPRSRGVYRGIPAQRVGQRGSSPLARGLRSDV